MKRSSLVIKSRLQECTSQTKEEAFSETLKLSEDAHLMGKVPDFRDGLENVAHSLLNPNYGQI